MSISTIESHLSHYLPTGEVNILDFLSDADLMDIKNEMNQIDEIAVTPLKQHFGERFSYGQLRMALTWLQNKP